MVIMYRGVLVFGVRTGVFRGGRAPCQKKKTIYIEREDEKVMKQMW